MDSDKLKYFTTFQLQSEVDRRTKVNQSIKTSIIISTILNHFDVTHDELYSQNRKYKIQEARNMIYYILYRVFKYKGNHVARLLGKTNHSSIIHGSNVVKGMVEVMKDYEIKVDNILDLIKIEQSKI